MSATLGRSAARPRTLAPLVLVTGGKGGVGKTTVAANLAVLLAREAGAARVPTTPAHPPDRSGGRVVAGEGREILLVDLDLGLADLGVFLRLPEGPGIEGHLERGVALEDCLVAGPEGLVVLPGSPGSHRMARPDGVRRARLFAGLARLSGRFGTILADSPAGIGPDVLHAAERAGRVLVVTTPEPAALADAYGLVKALDAHARESGTEVPTPELFVNLAADAHEARAVAERLASVCRRFLARSPRLAGWMPRSRAVAQSVALQEPFVLSQPRSPAALGLARLARRLSGGSRVLGT